MAPPVRSGRRGALERIFPYKKGLLATSTPLATVAPSPGEGRRRPGLCCSFRSNPRPLACLTWPVAQPFSGPSVLLNHSWNETNGDPACASDLLRGSFASGLTPQFTNRVGPAPEMDLAGLLSLSLEEAPSHSPGLPRQGLPWVRIGRGFGNPNGVASLAPEGCCVGQRRLDQWDRRVPVRNPYQGWPGRAADVTQGSGGAATLGYETQPRWGWPQRHQWG